MNNLIFSLNATMPVFLLMVLGMVFHKCNIIDDVLAAKLNKFVFLIPLPVLVFQDLAVEDFREAWDGKFVLFCFLVTLICICFTTFISKYVVTSDCRGEFIQATYRSSAALLGIALIQNIYGASTLGPLMIIGSVPLYNVCAVIVLNLFSPENPANATKYDENGNALATSKSTAITKEMLLHTLKGVVTNPIIIGIVIGIVWSLLRLPLGGIPAKVVSSVAATASPIGLMAMGASIDFKKAVGKLPPALLGVFIKLILHALIFLPIAIWLGFRGEALIALTIMLGTSTTMSCFVMAKNSGYEGTLTANIIMLTTLFSAFTLTMWIFILRSLGVI